MAKKKPTKKDLEIEMYQLHLRINQINQYMNGMAEILNKYIEFGGKANTKSEKQFLNTWTQINPKEIRVNLAGGAANSTEVSQGIPSPTPDNTTQKSSNPLQGALQTGLSIAKKGLSMIPGMPAGAGDISFLPLPLDQGAQGETSFASPNPTPQVAFSAHDPNAIFTANTYGTFG